MHIGYPFAILLLCPYSVQAILIALFICGMDSFLLAYDSGFCRNYKEWRKADLGDKSEITQLHPSSWEKLLAVMEKFDRSKFRNQKFRREGNIFFPCS